MKKIGLVLIFISSFLMCCSLPKPLPKPPLSRVNIPEQNIQVESARHQFITALLNALDASHKVKHGGAFQNEFKEKIKDQIDSGVYKYSGVQKLAFKNNSGVVSGSGLDIIYEKKDVVSSYIIIRFWVNNNSEIIAGHSPPFKAYANRDKIYEDAYILITTLSTIRVRKSPFADFKKRSHGRPWDATYKYVNIGDFAMLENREGLPVSEKEIFGSSILYFDNEESMIKFSNMVLNLFPNVTRR